MALTEKMTNVPPPLEDYNVFTSNRPLVESLARWAPGAMEDATAFGELVGRSHVLELGRLANEHPPSLRGSGEITFHPAWHELMRMGREAGLTGLGWDGTPGGNVLRAAAFISLNQVE